MCKCRYSLKLQYLIEAINKIDDFFLKNLEKDEALIQVDFAENYALIQ